MALGYLKMESAKGERNIFEKVLLSPSALSFQSFHLNPPMSSTAIAAIWPLRKRLGWEAGIWHGEGGKPTGMRWKTHWRLKSDHDALLHVSVNDKVLKLDFQRGLFEA